MTPVHRPSRILAWGLPALTALLIALAPAPRPAAPPTGRLIRLSAGDFAYSPATLRVNPGDRVTLELTSTDYVHGLYLDGYNLNLTADPGQTARLTFTADRPGSFRFRCSVTCGPLHPFMLGKLNVGPNWLFWRALALALSVPLLLAGYWALAPDWRSRALAPGRPRLTDTP